MAKYLYHDSALDDDDEDDGEDIVVIEDRSLFTRGPDGRWGPGFVFIDAHTVRAHPSILDVLITDAQRLWTLEELLDWMEA